MQLSSANAAVDLNNYHLAYDSFCIDKANPFLTYTGQVDLDGEGIDRKYGSAVDIGADEVYDCEDDYFTEVLRCRREPIPDCRR